MSKLKTRILAAILFVVFVAGLTMMLRDKLSQRIVKASIWTPNNRDTPIIQATETSLKDGIIYTTHWEVDIKHITRAWAQDSIEFYSNNGTITEEVLVLENFTNSY